MSNYGKEVEEKCYGFRRKTVRIFSRDFNERKKKDHKFSIFRPPTSNAKDNFEGPNPSQMFPCSLIFFTS